MRVAIYGRVSTSNGQTTANKLRQLRAVAKRAGWEIVAVYTDEDISGPRTAISVPSSMRGSRPLSGGNST